MAASRTRWWQALLMLSTAVVLTLVAAELGLRAYYWSRGIGRGDVREILIRSRQAEIDNGGGLFGLLEPSPWPDQVYGLKPHLDGVFLDASLKTNRWGFRGHDVEKEKPPGVVRVAGIGDSHMFGWGMPEGDYYMARLEAELNRFAEPGVRFETLDFGVPGFNTVMEGALYEHTALAFEPDVVLVHFVGNDFVAPHFLDPPRSFEPSRWALMETVQGLFGEVERELDGEEIEPAERQALKHAAAEPYREIGGSEGFRKALHRIDALDRPRGVLQLFMVLGHGTPRRRFALWTARQSGFHGLEPSAYFSAMLERKGAEPTAESFRALFTRPDQHPTALGHETFAWALRCELAYLGLQGLRSEATADCLPVQSLPPVDPSDEPGTEAAGAH